MLQDQDPRISVLFGLQTKTVVSRTTRLVLRPLLSDTPWQLYRMLVLFLIFNSHLMFISIGFISHFLPMHVLCALKKNFLP